MVLVPDIKLIRTDTTKGREAIKWTDIEPCMYAKKDKPRPNVFDGPQCIPLFIHLSGVFPFFYGTAA